MAPALPTIRNHSTSIKTFVYKYPAGMATQDVALFDSSPNTVGKVDLALISDSTQPALLRAAGATAPFVKYLVISKLYWAEMLAYANWADANGHSREDAWFHVTNPIAISASPIFSSSFGADGFPVRWWWDAQRFTASGSTFTNLYNVLQGTTGTGNLADAPYVNGSQSTTLGAAVNDAIWLGFQEKFDEINFTLSTGAAASFAYVIEYPTAVDGNGVPNAWQAIAVTSDTTSGLTQSGKIRFNPVASPAWVKSYAKSGGSGMFDPTQGFGQSMQGFYVRIRTTHVGTTPIATVISAADYTGQGDGIAGTIPAFDYSADINSDGYLNDTEYAARASGKNARFAYQSRLPTGYGTNMLWANYLNANLQTWVAQYAAAIKAAIPQYDGFFLDDSNGSTFPGTIEYTNATDFANDVGNALGTIWSGMSDGPSGTHLLCANMGPSTVLPGILNGCPVVFHEVMCTDADGWVRFEAIQNTLNSWAAASTPSPIQIIDTYATQATTSAAPTDRAKMALLAEYLLLSSPQTYICPLGRNFQSFGDNVDDNFLPNRWMNAIGFAFGDPKTDSYSVYAGPTPDPDDPTKTYKVYWREFENVIVFWKSLSDNGSGVTGNPNGTPTTHNLPSKCFPISISGAVSGTGVTSVSLHNGEGAIFMLAPVLAGVPNPINTEDVEDFFTTETGPDHLVTEDSGSLPEPIGMQFTAPISRFHFTATK